MVRPRVARGFIDPADNGLASMYPASDWSVCSGPSWISARVRSHYRTGLDRAIWVTSVRMRREDRSSIVVSSSRRPRRANYATSSIGSSSCFALFLCSCLAAVPSSRPAGPGRAARRCRQGWPSRRPRPLRPCCQATPCTAPSTARGLRWTGCYRIGLDAREGAPLVENRPRDAGKLIGQRNGEHIVVQSLLRHLDPGFEPIAFPLLGPELDQHDPGCLNEESAQVAIAAPRYAAEDSPVSRRDLFRDQPEPSAEVAAFGEHLAGADRSHHRARDDRTDAGDRHQSLAVLILMGERSNLAGKALDTHIQVARISCQLLDDARHAGRENIGARPQDPRQLDPQETQSLPYRNAP